MFSSAHRPCELFYPITCTIKVTGRNRAWEYDSGRNRKKALQDTESSENLKLLAGDSIMISFQQEVVMVRGEVFVPAAVVQKKGASLSYYLDQAGGMKEEADEDRVVVTLPNGRKWEEGWFIFPNPDILGGSTIFVPTKIEKEDKTLPIIRDWATITVSFAAIIIGIVQITK